MRHSCSKFRALAALALLIVMGSGCAKDEYGIHSIRGVDRYVRGAEEYEGGKSNDALIDLNAAVVQNPDLTMAHVLMGDIYKSRSDYRDASDHFAAAARLDPYDYKNHYNLGLAYQFLNRLQEAAECYLRALNLNPRDLDSTMNLGLVYLGLNQPREALDMMRRAVALAPQSSAAHCNLGVALDAQPDLWGAEREYRRAVELDANSAVPLTNLGENLIRQNRSSEAEDVLQAALQISDTTDCRKKLGDALVLSGKDDEAYRQYALAIKRDPAYWQALNEAGMIIIRKYVLGASLDERLRHNAIAIWQRSLKIQPDQPAIEALVVKWEQGGKVLP